MARGITSEKVTFSLPTRIIQEVRRAVAEGAFPSQNALVCEALQKELQQIEYERLRREFQDAARDPEFLLDLEETQAAFEFVDTETARMIPRD